MQAVMYEKESKMIEYLGFAYGLAKDVFDYLKWAKEEKIVDREWLEKSGFGEHMENQGFKLYWSKRHKIETRKLEGWEILYEIDKLKRVQRSIKRTSGKDSLILLGKKINT